MFALAVSLASAGRDKKEGKTRVLFKKTGPPNAVTPVALCVKIARILLNPFPPHQSLFKENVFVMCS